MKQYDTIIIGSGLSGLTLGATLSQEGLSVALIEKNPRAGGCLQSFYRYGRLLDTGMHYLGSLDPGQIMHQYFKYLGIMPKLKLRRLDSEGYDQIHYGGRHFSYAIGHNSFVDRLSQDFPAEREAIGKYCDRLKQIGASIGVEQLHQGRFNNTMLNAFQLSARQEIEQIISDETLRQVLAASNILYGGEPDRSSFYHHAIINNSYIESAWRLVDGSQQLADLLIERIKANGGELFCSAEATKVLIHDGRVSAVEINHSEQIACKIAISTIDPHKSLSMVEKTPLIRRATLSRLNTLARSYGLFSVYLLQKPLTCPYKNHNSIIISGRDAWHTPQPQEKGFNNFMISMQAASESPQYTDVICIIAPMYIGELDRWRGSTVDRRGQDYMSYKQERAAQLIELAKQYYPDIAKHTEQVFATTPLSYLDYTGTPEGSAYGIIKDYKNPIRSLIPCHTRIGNYYLSGQNNNVHGALGVSLTAMLTAAEIVGSEYLAKKIAQV